MASITLDKVNKVYPDGTQAVHDLDLAVRDGEFVVLVGPSGCGKTTVLRMVAGLERVSTGTLRFGEEVVNDVPPMDRDVAMVFQNYALYPHMTVARNIAFALRLQKIPKHQVQEKVEAAARTLGLSDYLGQKPAQLSGGQRQRVAMGRALVRAPSVFLMDEPLSNLDAKLRVQMRTEIASLQRRLGVATLYVTHDQVEAMTMGDRVAVMKAGRLQQFAAPDQLYACPANLEVAEFIGSPPMNLFEGSLSAEGDQLHIGSQVVAVSRRALQANGALAAYRNRKLAVGIRPEHLTLGADDAGPAPALKVSVVLVEALGNEHLVHFSIEGSNVHPRGTDDLVNGDGLVEQAGQASGTARLDPGVQVRTMDTIGLAVDASKLHFFDLATGERIANAGP